MYGLRSINNMYSEHAGSRSDFLIMGDPQFQFGKVHSCTKGYHASWDARPVPAHPRKNMARARSTGDLVKQLYAPGPIGLLKERALQRSMTKFDVPPLSPRGSGALVNSFAAFQDALLADGEAQRPKFGEQGLRCCGLQRTCTNVPPFLVYSQGHCRAQRQDEGQSAEDEGQSSC
ncbi:unnamed protein product, partial [Polarella glacialis]